MHWMKTTRQMIKFPFLMQPILNTAPVTFVNCLLTVWLLTSSVTFWMYDVNLFGFGPYLKRSTGSVTIQDEEKKGGHTDSQLGGWAGRWCLVALEGLTNQRPMGHNAHLSEQL